MPIEATDGGVPCEGVLGFSVATEWGAVFAIMFASFSVVRVVEQSEDFGFAEKPLFLFAESAFVLAFFSIKASPVFDLVDGVDADA